MIRIYESGFKIKPKQKVSIFCLIPGKIVAKF